MRNNMKELNEKYAYNLEDLNDEQRGELYDCLLSVDSTYNSTRKMDFKEVDNDLVFYDFYNDEWEWYSKDEFIEKEIELEIINALTLFEFQPKQGDKVLVSNNSKYWAEGEFITKYKDEFIVKTDYGIVRIKNVKPYKDEIKVGDWVMVNDEKAIIKINEQGIKYLDNYTKITDEVLINKLNEL